MPVGLHWHDVLFDSDILRSSSLPVGLHYTTSSLIPTFQGLPIYHFVLHRHDVLLDSDVFSSSNLPVGLHWHCDDFLLDSDVSFKFFQTTCWTSLTLWRLLAWFRSFKFFQTACWTSLILWQLLARFRRFKFFQSACSTSLGRRLAWFWLFKVVFRRFRVFQSACWTSLIRCLRLIDSDVLCMLRCSTVLKIAFSC